MLSGRPFLKDAFNQRQKNESLYRLKEVGFPEKRNLLRYTLQCNIPAQDLFLFLEDYSMWNEAPRHPDEVSIEMIYMLAKKQNQKNKKGILSFDCPNYFLIEDRYRKQAIFELRWSSKRETDSWWFSFIFKEEIEERPLQKKGKLFFI